MGGDRCVEVGGGQVPVGQQAEEVGLLQWVERQGRFGGVGGPGEVQRATQVILSQGAQGPVLGQIAGIHGQERNLGRPIKARAAKIGQRRPRGWIGGDLSTWATTSRRVICPATV